MNLNKFTYDDVRPLERDQRSGGDDSIDLHRLAGMARRQAKVVALCTIIGLGLGLAYVHTTPPTYLSMATVLIDDQTSRPINEVSPMPAQMQTDAEILDQIEIIESSRLASAVAAKLNLAENEVFLSPPISLLSRLRGEVRGRITQLSNLFVSGQSSRAPLPDGPDAQRSMADLRKEVAADLVRSGLRAQRVGRSNVISIVYQSHDRLLAGEIAKTYVDAYLADQVKASFDATQRAAAWLQERLASLHGASQAAAMAVERYRADSGLSEAKGALMSEQRLSDLNAQLVVAQADVASAQARFDHYRFIADKDVDEAVKSPVLSEEDPGGSVLSTLRTQYLDLSRREEETAASFGGDHPQAVALRREMSKVAAQIGEEIKRVSAIRRNEYQVALAREKELAAGVAEASTQNSEAQQAQVGLKELEQKSEMLSTLYQTYLARHEEVLQQRSFPIARVRVLSDPVTPDGPAGPRLLMVLGFSLVLGLMAGGGLGALKEFNENAFRTSQQIRDELALRFIGYLPWNRRISRSRKQRRSRPRSGDAGLADALNHMSPFFEVAAREPGSAFAETLRNARVVSDLLLPKASCRVIGIVSALPGEGKSTVAANLAALMASGGSKTLLIDGDLRRSALSRGFGVQDQPGLAEVVLEGAPWSGLVRSNSRGSLTFLQAGVHRDFVHNGEILSSAGMRDLLEEVRSQFSYVVVDLPPIGPAADARAFAPLADGFIFVVEWGRTPKTLVKTLLEAEPFVSEKVLGVVLNKVDIRKLAKFAPRGSAEKHFGRFLTYYKESR